MMLKWLEDFEALVEYKNFSRAAESRHVTQPAFSRRIRSLESWLGIILIDREQRPMMFTDAGIEFITESKRLIDEIYRTRESLRINHSANKNLLFLAQHSIAVAFFPSWLDSLSNLIDNSLVQMHAGNYTDISGHFFAGTGDFLLCFASPDSINNVNRSKLDFIQLGIDELLPVSVATKNNEPLHNLQIGRPLRLLAYPDDSFLGNKIKPEYLYCHEIGVPLQRVFENALADGLKALVAQGHGIAWLPYSLIKSELDNGSLVVLPVLRKVQLKIFLYCSTNARKPEVDRIWKKISAMPSYKFISEQSNINDLYVNHTKSS